MGELTKQDMLDAFREVLASREYAVSLETVITRVMTDKIERTFGIDCTDPDIREATRRNLVFLHKARQWAESVEGQSDIANIRRVSIAINGTASNLVKAFLYAVLAGLMVFAGVGVSTHDGLKNLFR